MSLCHICKGLDESVSAVHGVPLPQIRDSFDSGRGCKTCGILLQSYLAFAKNGSNEHDVVIGWDTMRLEAGLRVVVKHKTDNSLVFTVDLHCREEDLPPWELHKHGERPTELSGDTASDGAVSKIEEWIQECQSNHSCGSLVAATHYPARVLEVSEPSSVRLHDTSIHQPISYACLSHCWGLAQSLVTTTANVLQHQDHIPWSSLPKSFQDAVGITRRLNIPYLWIDSLCIIQDSQEDWQVESAKMASIYAGSTVTIAATMSSSDHQGFTAKAPLAHTFRKITYMSKSGLPQTIHARLTLPHGTSLTPFPLLTRGWVLQERLLSPRVVHFTPDEVIWECMQHTTCECGCIRSLWSPGWVPFNKNLLHATNLAKMSMSELRDTWHQIVQEYSRLDLTFSHDKLPAISGAARRLSAFRGCAYYAGLWKQSFVRDLMWKRIGRLDMSVRLDNVPSWSWASINNEITFDDEVTGTTEMVALMDIAANSSPDSSLFYEARECTALLSGFLVSWQQVRNKFKTVYQDTGFNPTLASLGCLTFDSDEYIPIDHNICFLKLAYRHRVSENDATTEISLVLQPVDMELHVYRRVGLLERSFEGTQPDVDIYVDSNDTTVLSLL